MDAAGRVYIYAEPRADQTLAPILPDSDQHVVSAGVGIARRPDGGPDLCHLFQPGSFDR